jgi:hypothetical protein
MPSSSLHEESPLLVKSGKAHSHTYSQGTFDTLATSDSDEDEEQDEEQGILGTIVEDANALVEGVYEEIHDVAGTIMEDLHEADDGDMCFLDMGLMRNISILPYDIMDAASSQPPPYSQAHTNTYTQRTFDTLATSDTDESVVNSKSYLAEDVLGSIVFFETNIKEETTEGEPEDASTLMEWVVEEIQEAAENIMETLHEADEGDMYFLEMGLIRNTSILPGDITHDTRPR